MSSSPPSVALTKQSQAARAKIILLGDAYVGKTSLIIRYVRNTFSPAVQATVGSAYISKVVPMGGGRGIRLDLWDTAGQERFRGMNMGLYYRAAVGAVVVYDVTSRESFEGVKRWVGELRRMGGGGGSIEDIYDEGGRLKKDWYKGNGMVIALAGNKRDLTIGDTAGGIRGEALGLPTSSPGVPKREVSEDEARDYARSEGMLFFETSAKSDADDGVFKLFEELVFWVNVKLEGEGISGKNGADGDEEKIQLSMPSKTSCC